ncbi:MAG: hypothetical protein V7765_22005, partial [Oleispira sp.]
PKEQTKYDESTFYIDENDNPPWDTWFHYKQTEDGIALYSWIAPELIELINSAIEMDAYDCLVWAVELEKSLINEI